MICMVSTNSVIPGCVNYVHQVRVRLFALIVGWYVCMAQTVFDR